MSTPHRATADHWAAVEEYAQGVSSTDDCLLELRARVEALEREAAMNELRAASADARPAPSPADSLAERVARAIHPDRCADPNLYLHEARAAIREVAAWLVDRGGYPWAWVAQILEKEAER
jgi:hypothetical protein